MAEYSDGHGLDSENDLYLEDRSRFMGRDILASRMPDYSDNYDMVDDLDEFHNHNAERERWQWEMQQQEEILVENALRRMNRARLRGEVTPPLTREEVDALERRQLISTIPREQALPVASTTKASAAKVKRKPVTSGTATSSSTRKSNSPKTTVDRRTSLPESSNRRDPDQLPYVALYPYPPRNQASPSPSRKPPYPGPRGAYGSTSRQMIAQDPRDYRPSSRLSQTDNHQSLRSRAGSAAQLQTAQYDSQLSSDPYAGYPVLPATRRYVSGPAALPYSSRSLSRSFMHNDDIDERTHDIIEISDSEESNQSGRDAGVRIVSAPYSTSTAQSASNPPARGARRAPRGRR